MTEWQWVGKKTVREEQHQFPTSFSIEFPCRKLAEYIRNLPSFLPPFFPYSFFHHFFLSFFSTFLLCAFLHSFMSVGKPAGSHSGETCRKLQVAAAGWGRKWGAGQEWYLWVCEKCCVGWEGVWVCARDAIWVEGWYMVGSVGQECVGHKCVKGAFQVK